jgi:acyl carrier protein
LDQKDIIKNFIYNNIIMDGDKIEFGYEESLIETGIIDSLAIVKIITFLEIEFRIKINDEDILPENFESVIAMSDFINIKKK